MPYIYFLPILLLLLCHPLCAQIYPQTFERAALANVSNLPQADQSPGTATENGNRRNEDDTTWKTVLPAILEDQRRIYWDFPRDLIHGKHLLPVAAFLGATGALIALDQFEPPYFRKTTGFHGYNTGLSGTNSSLVTAAVPIATYVTGLIRKDPYAQGTALLAGVAVADSEITAEVLKLVTRRARPESISANGNFADSFLDSRSITQGGFPSGHTTAAFSVATVMSRRYGHDHRWVPYVAYGVAGAIGFSRVTLSAHNVSDVFVGAALGYAISRFVVLGHHH